MINFHFKSICFALAIILLATSCNKDVDETVNLPEGIPEYVEVTSTIIGTVEDEQGAPLSDVTVSLDNESTTTDEFGAFILTDIKMNENGSLVKFSKTNRFDAYKLISGTNNKTIYTKVNMISKMLSGKFAASSGGTIEIRGGGSVDFAAGDLVLEDGTAYNGEVSVYTKRIDPANENEFNLMPGDLSAINTEESLQQLASYAMAAIELEATDGTPLNLAAGSSASITFPIANEYLSTAPQTIPLWYFDTSTGYWIEEGAAELVGDDYVATVTHFSFWNCDAPFDVVGIKGKLVDENGIALAGKQIKITILSNNLMRSGFSDEEGRFSGKVAKDEEIEILVQDHNFCVVGLYSDNVAASSTDIDLGEIVVDVSNSPIHPFTVSIVDCDQNTVSNAYGVVSNGTSSMMIAMDDDGNVNAQIPECSGAFSFRAIDYTLGKTSEQLDYPNGINAPIDAGELRLCDDLDTYFRIEVDGVSYETTTAVVKEFEEGLLYRVENTFELDTLDIIALDFTADISYMVPNMNLEVGTVYYDRWSNFSIANFTESYFCEPSNCLEIVHTEIDSYFTATFEGSIQRSSDGEFVPIKGSFRAIKI